MTVTLTQPPAPRTLPLLLGTNHPFQTHPADTARSQCRTCFGWRDDPRHWVRP